MSQSAPSLQANWDWRAAGNSIGGGTGAGLLLAAAIAWLDGFPYWPLGLIALTCIGLGLVCVWAKIGRPWRALYKFFHRRTSWMTWEVLISLPLFGAAISAVALDFLSSSTDYEVPVLIWISALSAAAYLSCQARILRQSKDIPVCRHPSLIPVMVMTGLCEGFAVLAIFALFIEGPNPWISTLLSLFLIFRAIAWFNYYYEMRKSGAPEKAIAVLKELNLIMLSAGIGLALFLALIGVFINEFNNEFGAAAGLVSLLSGWYLKFSIIARASYNQGVPLADPPLRGATDIEPGSTKPGSDEP